MQIGDVQKLILTQVDSCGKINTGEISKAHGIDHQLVVGAANSLAGKEMVITTMVETLVWALTEEGKSIAKDGSHEAKVFHAVPKDGINQSELHTLLGDSAKIGIGKALKAKWISIQNGFITKITENIVDETQQQLQQVGSGQLGTSTLNDLKKRKLANPVEIKTYDVTKGPQFSFNIVKYATDLDQAMILSGEWKNQSFKKYNFNTQGIAPTSGHLHPLLKVREEFRKIFFEMGFSEMPTNNFVESSFWNFDTLFQPQQHPARDAHDTFFLKDPERAHEFPEEYLEAVKKVHAEGGYGSLGYRYDWKKEEAEKNILRTHTTAVSARMLYKLAKQEKFVPTKYFSIDRVFRNEALDATHLAEFHQIEGLIADYDLSLGDLIGILEIFFKKLGMNRLRFKPAYNPYTEPSMEVFAFHEGLNKWIEIGNSGVFRPEMLLPMGLPPTVSVIAWGLSLERPTMIKYGINNIRDLCGHKIDLNVVQANPICRLEKN